MITTSNWGSTNFRTESTLRLFLTFVQVYLYSSIYGSSVLNLNVKDILTNVRACIFYNCTERLKVDLSSIGQPHCRVSVSNFQELYSFALKRKYFIWWRKWRLHVHGDEWRSRRHSVLQQIPHHVKSKCIYFRIMHQINSQFIVYAFSPCRVLFKCASKYIIYHLSAINLSSIYHQPIIYLSLLYQLSIINLSINHICLSSIFH
jgi:hypothetical protein